MKQKRYNQNRQRWWVGPVALIVCVAIGLPAEPLTAPIGAKASIQKSEIRKKDLQKLLSVGEFTALLQAVGELNRAMRIAAENPMDTWRRERVQSKVAAVQGAIRSLAGVFQANKLGNSKLPLVQQLLGGYVDVNAADTYNQFLQHPSANLIPNVGPDFPKQYLTGASQTQSLVIDEGAPSKTLKRGPLSSTQVFNSSIASKPKDEIAEVESGILSEKELSSRLPANANELIKINPKLLNAIPLSIIISSLMALETVASAEESDCDESGGEAAQLLFGLAAIMGAAAPMVAAAVQADADKQIAEKERQTAVTTTQISADSSKFLAKTQQDITNAQIAATQQTAAQNNEAVTQRMSAQITELRATREENNNLQREKRNIEVALNQERIALAQRQVDENVKLAKATLSAQIAQAGLSQGLAAAPGATNRLSVNRSVAATGGGTGVESLASSGVAARTEVPLRAVTQTGVQNPQQKRAVMSSRLLSVVQQDSMSIQSQGLVKARGVIPQRSQRVRTRSAQPGHNAARAVALAPANRQLLYAMQSNLDVIGSSPERRAGSDLSMFRAQVSVSGGESYLNFRKRAKAPLATLPVSGSVQEEARKAAGRRGYNRPTFVTEGSTHSLSRSGVRGFFNLPRR